MMLEVNFTVAKQRISPFIQVGIALGIGWVGMLICKLFNLPGAAPYFAAFIAIIFYALLNTVVSLAHASFFKYTVPSYYVFIALMAVLLLSARYASGISIWKLEEYRMMLLSIVLFYAIASILVRAVRFIYDAALNDY
jgi:hypothetical protein